MYEQDRKELADWAYASEKRFVRKLMKVCEDFDFDEMEDPLSQVLDHIYVMLHYMNVFYKDMTDEFGRKEERNIS